MVRALILTKDGSHTLLDQATGATFHSLHGAIQESEHVYIRALRHMATKKPSVSVVEMGFGTGLNALLSCMAADAVSAHVHYTAIEMFPLEANWAQQLNYCATLETPAYIAVFDRLHSADWESDQRITDHFTIHKINARMEEAVIGSRLVDIVYYDAFAPEVQPELWSREIFEKIGTWMQPGGMLTTYCSKGAVRRAMQAAGWRVKKMPGPPGKREIVHAFRDGG